MKVGINDRRLGALRTMASDELPRALGKVHLLLGRVKDARDGWRWSAEPAELDYDELRKAALDLKSAAQRLASKVRQMEVARCHHNMYVARRYHDWSARVRCSLCRKEKDVTGQEADALEAWLVDNATADSVNN